MCIKGFELIKMFFQLFVLPVWLWNDVLAKSVIKNAFFFVAKFGKLGF
jgi:hypothetical protein